MKIKTEIMSQKDMNNLFKNLDVLSFDQRKEIIDKFLDKLKERYCLECGTEQRFCGSNGCQCWNDD